MTPEQEKALKNFKEAVAKESSRLGRQHNLRPIEVGSTLLHIVIMLVVTESAAAEIRGEKADIPDLARDLSEIFRRAIINYHDKVIRKMPESIKESIRG